MIASAAPSGSSTIDEGEQSKEGTEDVGSEDESCARLIEIALFCSCPSEFI